MDTQSKQGLRWVMASSTHINSRGTPLGGLRCGCMCVRVRVRERQRGKQRKHLMGGEQVVLGLEGLDSVRGRGENHHQG